MEKLTKEIVAELANRACSEITKINKELWRYECNDSEIGLLRLRLTCILADPHFGTKELYNKITSQQKYKK